MEVMMIKAANSIGLSTDTTAAGENGDGDIDATFDFAGNIDVPHPPRAKKVRSKSTLVLGSRVKRSRRIKI